MSYNLELGNIQHALHLQWEGEMKDKILMTMNFKTTNKTSLHFSLLVLLRSSHIPIRSGKGLQSTSWLHSSTWSDSPTQLLPLTHWRVRYRVPPAHVALQLLQLLHDAQTAAVWTCKEHPLTLGTKHFLILPLFVCIVFLEQYICHVLILSVSIDPKPFVTDYTVTQFVHWIIQ